MKITGKVITLRSVETSSRANDPYGGVHGPMPATHTITLDIDGVTVELETNKGLPKKFKTQMSDAMNRKDGVLQVTEIEL